jgi:hypothetical protein
MDAPLAPALPPLGAWAQSIHLYCWYAGYTTPSQPGRHSGGEKPLERLRFWSLNKEHFFDSRILEQYSDYIFFRNFLYGLIVKMTRYPIFFA